jgi:hypothetical protein
MGSKDWMAPWLRGHRPEDYRPAADVYSSAKVLWSMLSGHREPLPREWWNREEHDLTKLFQEEPAMALANELFAQTIVENEKDCLRDGKALLDRVDALIKQLRLAPHPPELPRRPCRVCGRGAYEVLNDASALVGVASGVGGAAIRAERCSSCGHVEFFQAPSKGVLVPKFTRIKRRTHPNGPEVAR